MKVAVTQLDGITTMNALPLAAGLVVASARTDPVLRERAEFDIVVGNEPPDGVVAGLGRPDVLGLSLYLWNEQYSLEVARLARRAFPGCLIVAGGPAVPMRPEASEAYLLRYPFLDVLVLGEGEETFRELLSAHRDGTALSSLAGIAFREAGGGFCLTPPRPRMADFSATASPYLDGTFDQLLERYPERYPSYFAVAMCETNRGCPFHCTFCSAGLTDRDRVYEIPEERVLRELEWVAERGFPGLFLVDLNFGIRRRDADIARHLAGLKARTGYPGYCFFYLTKNPREQHVDLVDTLLKAGISSQVALATQSFDDGVLAAVKRSNIPSRKWQQLRELCHARGISTYNELILGLPAQTLGSFTSTIAQALSAPPRDRFYLYLCRVIPNSEMDEPAYRARHGIETRHCRAVPPDPRCQPQVDEYEEIVVATAAMPVADWRRAYTFGYLVSACTNQRLLNVVARYLRSTAGVDMTRYFEHLCDHLRSAPEGSVFAEMGDVVERYLASILSGGPVLLQAGGAGGPCLEVDDALVVVALRRRDGFFAEVRALTAAFLAREGCPTEPVAELLRFQRFVTPSLGTCQPRHGRFSRDWSSYLHEGGPAPEPVTRPTELRFVPPHYASIAEFGTFIDNHLAAIRARASTGAVAPHPSPGHGG